jgi:chromate reductase
VGSTPGSGGSSREGKGGNPRDVRPPALLVASPAQRHVATAIAFDQDGDCGVLNMSTLEAARRQGLGTALIARHVHDAVERGCSTASLQSTAMAERVYAAVGFRDLGRIFRIRQSDARRSRPGAHSRADRRVATVTGPTKVLLFSGSLRAESVNSAVLRTAAALAGDRIRTTLYEGMGTLPHFNPDDDPDGGPVPAAVADLRRRLADADAVLFCTPEYVGSLPGLLKNVLDWTVGGGETYGKPVAWINASSRPDPDAGSGAHDALRTVLG